MVHYATYITEKQDPNELESLMTTMDMGYHGVTINGIHPSAPKCGITIDNDYLPFEFDHESIFFNISKPTEHELALYKVYELNSKQPPQIRRIKRKREEYTTKFSELPLLELRKRFAMLPETIIKKTLENTT